MEIKYNIVKDPRPNRKMMTVLPKEVFDYWFIDKFYSRSMFKEKLGVSDKIFQNSYQLYYTKEERKQFFKNRIAYSQSRKNTNSKNKGVPRIKLDKVKLETYLREGRKILWIADKFSVSPQVVKNNINYYQISLSEIRYNSYLSYSDIIDLRAFDDYFGINLLDLHTEGENRQVQKIIDFCISMDYELKSMQLLLKKIRKNTASYAKANNIDFDNKKLPNSMVNHLFAKAFEDLGVSVENEYQIDNRFYDLRIKNTKILVEIDSKHYHSDPKMIENDKLKTKLARENGFELVRIETNKDKFPSIKNKTIQCLKQLKSAGLLQ